MDPNEKDTPVSRRTLLAAGSGGALALTVLAACSGGSSGSTAGSPPPETASTGPGSGSSSGGDGGRQVLAKLSDVPVGGAVSAQDAAGRPVIVAQPRAGEVVAFSAICTHMGCTVAPHGKILQCPCHGSTYDLATGDNTGGPAPRPLTELKVKVRGGSVVES